MDLVFARGMGMSDCWGRGRASVGDMRPYPTEACKAAVAPGGPSAELRSKGRLVPVLVEPLRRSRANARADPSSRRA